MWCVCVCVCVCVRVCGAAAQLVRKCIWTMETFGLQVQVTVMASYGIISLKQKTYTQLLLSTQE